MGPSFMVALLLLLRRCRTKFLENPQKYLEPETVKSAAESLPEGTVATYGKTPG
jgi:hypothetical protein